MTTRATSQTPLRARVDSRSVLNPGRDLRPARATAVCRDAGRALRTSGSIVRSGPVTRFSIPAVSTEISWAGRCLQWLFSRRPWFPPAPSCIPASVVEATSCGACRLVDCRSPGDPGLSGPARIAQAQNLQT